MFRWLSCCCLVLGMTALTWADLLQSDLQTYDKEGEVEATGSGSTLFGLQVQLGLDDPPSRTTSPSSDLHSTLGKTSSREIHSYRGHVDLMSAEELDDEEPIPHLADVDDVVCCYEWQVLPVGLMYKSYLAGEKESRMQFAALSEKRRGMVWETALGGRVGLLRYGTRDPIHPEGWQFDLEGAALPRVDPQQHDDLEAVDFRAGFLSTWCFGPNRFKAGYYHLSSHVGDEFLIRNPAFVRLNYVRDSAIAGWTRDITPNSQVYGEIAYAFNHEDGALPLEFQYGFQYSPLVFGLRGAPFGAINGHTRQDFNYETSINVVAGWQWRGMDTNHTLRVGMQYYDGPSMQYSFVNKHESLFGGGIWFDY